MKIGSGSRFSILSFSLLVPLAVGGLFYLPCARGATVGFIAHRGGFAFAPENTCAAFRACETAAVSAIEFDVRTSADGALVLMHDDTVTRTTTGYGAVTQVAGLTLAELKTLDAGAKFSPIFAGERIPTLAEGLRACPAGIPVLIHCKAVSATALRDALVAENALSNSIIYSDTWNFLYAFRQLEPHADLCAGGNFPVKSSDLASLRQNGIGKVCWDTNYVTQAAVDLVHEFGMTIRVSAYWQEIQPFLDMGVDQILVGAPRLAAFLANDRPRSNAELARDLVAYWKLDDGLLDSAATNAADVEDLSPIQLAKAAAAPTWISGDEARFGGALRLDGTNDYARVPTNGTLDIGTNAVSISMWVKLSSLPSAASNGYACIYDSAADGYSIYLDAASKELRFKTTDANLLAARPGIPESKLRTDTWHHVVGVFVGSASPVAGAAMIYLDGQIRDVHYGSDSTPLWGLTNVVRRGQAATLGRNGPNDGYFFGGAVDDVAIWRRPLFPNDVKQIYAAGTNGIPLERKVMAIWFTTFNVDSNTDDFVFDVQIAHGSLTDQSLVLRGSSAIDAPYVEQAVLEKRRGRYANYHVPRNSKENPAISGSGDAGEPCFFQMALP